MAMGLFLVIAAAVMLGVAGLLIVLTDSPEAAEWYYALLAFGGAAGFVGVKIP